MFPAMTLPLESTIFVISLTLALLAMRKYFDWRRIIASVPPGPRPRHFFSNTFDPTAPSPEEMYAEWGQKFDSAVSFLLSAFITAHKFSLKVTWSASGRLENFRSLSIRRAPRGSCWPDGRKTTQTGRATPCLNCKLHRNSNILLWIER